MWATYYWQIKVRSNTVVLHAVGRSCVDQSGSLSHGHMISRQQRCLFCRNCGMLTDSTFEV